MVNSFCSNTSINFPKDKVGVDSTTKSPKLSEFFRKQLYLPKTTSGEEAKTGTSPPPHSIRKVQSSLDASSSPH